MATCDFKWDGHCSSLLSFLGSYMNNEKLVDVTLAAEGKVIHVHRLVLLASSSYFEELLSLYPEKQAVIFLRDVSFDILQSLVQFIYQGKVSLPHDQVISFMQTACSLKIKGVSFVENCKQLVLASIDVDNNLQPVENTIINTQPTPVQTPVPLEKEITEVPPQFKPVETAPPSGSDTVHNEEAEGFENNDTIDLEHTGVIASCSNQMEVSYVELTSTVIDMSSAANGISLFENLISSPVLSEKDKDNDRPKPSGRLSWSPRDRFNGKSRSSMSNSRTRKRSEVLQQAAKRPKPFVCPKECGRNYTSKWGLKQHLLECGMPPRYQCPMCSSCFKRPDHLKVHAKRVHGVASLVTGIVGEPNEMNSVNVSQSKEAEENPVDSPEQAIEYEVDEILARRLLPGKTDSAPPIDTDFEYLVSWKGCGVEENTWEPYENLAKCKKKLISFLRSINTSVSTSNSKRRSVRK